MRSVNKSLLLILTDSLSTRVFFSSGIVQRLWRECGGQLKILALFDVDSVFDYRQWLTLDEDISVNSTDELGLVGNIHFSAKLYRLFDGWLDKYFGFFPLAVRFCFVHNYHLSRFRKRHNNPFLNTLLALPCPRSNLILTLLKKWYFSSVRYVDPGIEAYLIENINGVIPTNLQMFHVQEYLRAARKAGIKIIGHIGSWDHPVGKGVVAPYCYKYIVQNEYMKKKLIGQHNIDEKSVVVTGWPQMDCFARKSKKREFSSLLDQYGLEPERKCVLLAGNSESNAPYEPLFVERLVDWWESNSKEDFSIIFRPHPRDIIHDNWKKRFSFLQGKKNVYVQAANYADIKVLSLLLQNVSCVVTNAGTILLDSICNNRPVVCVLYDEKASSDSNKYAMNNVAGDHYQELLLSNAFICAYNFQDVVAGIQDSLQFPARLQEERKIISTKLVGEIDGLAGKRVADAIAAEFF